MNTLNPVRIKTNHDRRFPHEPGLPILSANHLTVTYGQVKALEDVSFELAAADRVAVIGPNGAGKSTLFKVISGILRPTAGDVQIFGHEPGGHLCISYLPQRSQVDWNFPVTVANVVMMGRTGRLGLLHWPAEEDRKIVKEALELVKLSDLADRQISELSGGQQQRMFIARALAQKAELMLMDEPFTGLDHPSQDELFAILEVLHEQKVTVLVALHDLKMASEHFDRVMLLNHRLLAFGTGAHVLREDILSSAYEGKIQMVPTSNGLAAFDDTCCGGEGHAHD